MTLKLLGVHRVTNVYFLFSLSTSLLLSGRVSQPEKTCAATDLEM
jgi:hypothetical protein